MSAPTPRPLLESGGVTPVGHGRGILAPLALYFPYDSFVGLAQGLADLAKGNATTIYAAMGITPIDCECNSTTPFHDNAYDAAIAISCGDVAPQNDTVAQLQAYDASVQAINSLADIWGNERSFRSGWKLHREDRFKGPFGAPNTSFPLFVIGNTADPVTPIAGAQWTADAFPGSVLLTLDSPGIRHPPLSTINSI
ncbi:hypothetical protein B0H13DRAFT_2083791 [Mycena leptocephala]|nr:hypothetical protein B0H13DRAFT_2083791 [Mycena leptocephala]